MSLWPTEEQQHQDAIRRGERLEVELAVYKHLLKKADVVVAAAQAHASAMTCPYLAAAIKDYRESCADAIDAVKLNANDLVKAFTNALKKVAEERSK